MKHFNTFFFLKGGDYKKLHYTVNTYSVQQNYLLLVRKQHIFGTHVTVRKEKTFIASEANSTLYRTN
jgi:hypothetical protein